MDDEQDFITLSHSVRPEGKFCVEVRRWDRVQDAYIVVKCSMPLNQITASALALSWAKALKLEIR